MVATSEKTKDAEVVQVNLNEPALFINRELSMLEFQRRVLEEAQEQSNPLLERVKFLSIVGSNLDEFFMVRMAGLRKQVLAGWSISAGWAHPG
jgi:polyphosphate kinase